MTTEMHDPSARPTSRTALVRRLVAVGALAPLLAVAACNGEDPITARTAIGSATTTAPPQTATDSVPTPSTTTASSAGPVGTVWHKSNAVIKDPVLGNSIRVLYVVRNVRWPAGHPVAQETFEIIGIRVEVTAGTRYSAEVTPALFTLTTTTTTNAPTTTEFGSLLGAPLKTTERAQKRSGWIYFKVNRGSGSSLQLTHHRPQYKVSTTGKVIPADTFAVQLLK